MKYLSPLVVVDTKEKEVTGLAATEQNNHSQLRVL